ncbi:MAG: MFS transporter [Chlorobiales bacterium]
MSETQAVPAQNDKRTIFGWAMYDWAVSAFSTTVVTVFLGPYLTALAKAASDSNGLLYWVGIPIKYDSLFAYCTSISVLLQAFFLPLLSAIADYSKRRKQFLLFFTLMGSIATMTLIGLDDGRHWFGASAYIVANIAFGAAMVFYNAFLPDIATKEQHDRVSSFGWGLGYLGGGLLLLLNLIFFTFRESLGLTTSDAVRICLASAGVWWLGFSMFTFATVRSRYAVQSLKQGETYLVVGIKELTQTFRDIKQLPETLKYLVAYLLYNDGVQTILVVATIFGSEELKMESSSLIQVILMVQIVAFIGSILFGKIAERLGAKQAVVICLVIWCAVTIYAWYFLSTALEFWGMAAVVALVMGGTQALSRSLFSVMIPEGKEAAFFSFYELSERGTSWVGPFLFGLINQLFGGLRYGILSLIVLFVSGLVVLLFVNIEKAKSQADMR